MTGTQRPGVHFDEHADSCTFSIYSKNASRVVICFFGRHLNEEEKLSRPLDKKSGDIWSISITLGELRDIGIGSVIYYGYRAWGPNWPYDPDWTNGSEVGFVCDVDNDGNRFNPNKLLIDPYAREISHDPQPRLSHIDPNEYIDNYYTSEEIRHIDTGRKAPKAIALARNDNTSTGTKPKRLLKDDVIYEVHVRGFTKLDNSMPAEYRGTYKGAGERAGYLNELGITAVEFLPVHAFANEQNDDGDPRGDNYWGYMTLGFFAPNRRYAFDRSPGGPTREFKEMVKAFHDHGIKVFIDVVYNHTGEGLLKRSSDTDDSRGDDSRQDKDRACLLSFRGIDNATYYELRSNTSLDNGRTRQRYQDNSGCGGNLNVTEEAVRDFVIDSLKYWSEEMGVDGFRFDLAPVLGNNCPEDGFQFDRNDKKNILNRAAAELPARNPRTLEGIDLIAEPWAVGHGTYQLGSFPDGWAEWNDVYRDTFRKAENKLNVDAVMPWMIANAFSGSEQQFRNKRSDTKPSSSINYIVSHDGFTLRDVFSYSAGSNSWDHDQAHWQQRKAVRNALTILMVSAGVPMITGGDEMFRSLGGIENSVAMDNEFVYLDWNNVNMYRDALKNNNTGLRYHLREQDNIKIFEYAKNIINFRNMHPALRPSEYFTGLHATGSLLKDISWHKPDGSEVDGPYWDNPGNHFIAFRIDGGPLDDTAASIYMAYNKGAEGLPITLPENLPYRRWYRVCDTDCWMEALGNFDAAHTMLDRGYYLHDRSILVLIEQ